MFLVPVVAIGCGVVVLTSAFYSSLVYGVPTHLALSKAAIRLASTAVFRQIWSIVIVLTLMRFALEPTAKTVRDLVAQKFRASSALAAWEKSSTFFVLRDIYRPVELLLYAGATVAVFEGLIPVLIHIPRVYVSHVMRTIMTLCFILAAGVMLFNVKNRALQEASWESELSGDKAEQRRVEALDKIVTFLTITVGSTLSMQAIGFDVNSLLAIGGIGGIALSLAGREVLENLFNGVLIMSSQPFAAGDEITFRPAPTTMVEGIVMDVGWFRTQIRSFEREVWVVPNSVFSKIVIRNVTRRGTEFRYRQDLTIQNTISEGALNSILGDIRTLVRTDRRVIQTLHRRVFLSDITPNAFVIFISFYIDSLTADLGLAAKEDFMLQFVTIVKRHGGKLLSNELDISIRNNRVGQGPRSLVEPPVARTIDVDGGSTIIEMA